MKKILLITLLIVLTNSFAKAEEIAWLTDYKEAQKISQETGKPMLLDFVADWCKPCKAMDKVFWVRKDVIEFSKDFVCVKIDFDKSTRVKRKYKINTIPFVLATDPWGTALSHHRGFGDTSSNLILKKLKIVPKDFTEIKEARTILEEDKKNVHALKKVSSFYQERKFFYQSNIFSEDLIKLTLEPKEKENLMLNIAFNYIRSSMPNEAIEHLKKVQKRFPESSQMDVVLYGQIVAYNRKKKKKKSKKLFKELKAKFPNSKYIENASKILK